MRAHLARCFRRVGPSRTRLTDDHVLWAMRKTMLRKTYCLMDTDGLDGSGARVVQPHPADTDLTVHLGTRCSSPTTSPERRPPRTKLGTVGEGL